MKNVLVSLRTILAAGSLVMLCSCSSTPPEKLAFKFRVQQYRTPIEASHWTANDALSCDPESAALNVLAAMKKGDVDTWLAAWEPASRPKLSDGQRQALVQQWQAFNGSEIKILERVVADANVVVDLSVSKSGGAARTIRFPLTLVGDRWCLFAMNPKSEYLNWQSSNNHIMEYLDPAAFTKHVESQQSQTSKVAEKQ